MLDVVIIGAGPAGISAGRMCRQLKLAYRVLEADEQIGGRAKSVRILGKENLDLGAHWLHSARHNPLQPLAMGLGFNMNGAVLTDELYWQAERLTVDAAVECEKKVDAAMEAVASSEADVAVSSFSHFAGRWQPAFESAFAIKQGVACNSASSRDFASYVWEGDDLPVHQGFGNLVRKLGENLDISVTSEVDSIDLTSLAGIVVSGSFGSISARHVIITVSTSVLSSGRIRFIPELPEETAGAIANLPMGSCNKVAIAFNRQDFPEIGSDVLITPYGNPSEPVEIVAFEGGSELITGLFHGAFGKEIAAQGRDAMRGYLLETLRNLYGSRVIKAARKQTFAFDWDGNPFVGGYVSAAKPGCANAREILAAPVQQRLHFAGEATSRRFMGDVHGAWLEGVAAVERISERLLAHR